MFTYYLVLIEEQNLKDHTSSPCPHCRTENSVIENIAYIIQDFKNRSIGNTVENKTN